ncbi:MAG: DUF4160 domain-containing protein [Deltaproteobacteria bacterium]|nr:DUF4160 domain-containing protein [Deltaproteobacteria bacterium]
MDTSGRDAVFALTGECLSGDIGRRAHALFVEWCQENRESLAAAWDCAVNGREVPWIKPLL